MIVDEAKLSSLHAFTVGVQDYSTPCFDGEHNMVMGGSFASSGNAASVFSRFYFRPHFHQHASFRLVAPVEPEQAEDFVTSCTGEFERSPMGSLWRRVDTVLLPA